MLEVVLESLKAGLSQAMAREVRSGTEKGVRFQSKGAEEEIGLGVRLLAYLVSHNINRTSLLMKEREKLEEVTDVCLGVTKVVEERICQESLTIEEGALLAQVLHTELRLFANYELRLNAINSLETFNERKLSMKGKK